LERERRHVALVIPAALLRDLRCFAAGDPGALKRMTVALAGLSVAAAGYFVGYAGQAIRSRMARK
jgi:hypothetical protein